VSFVPGAGSAPGVASVRGLVAVPVVPAGRRTFFRGEGRPAAARGSRVWVLDCKAAAGDRLDKVDLGALQVADADRVDKQLDAV
jgi:hypothetical protein